MQETPSPSSENYEDDDRRETSPRQLRRQKGWYLGEEYEYGGGASPQNSDYDDLGISSKYLDQASSAESLTYHYGRTLGRISE